MFSEIRRRVKKTGQAPGTPVYTGSRKNDAPILTVIHYDTEHYQEKVAKKFKDGFSEEKVAQNTWVNLEGLHDVDLVKKLSAQFHLHPLTTEDILNVEQRAKIDEFDEYLFITLKTFLWQEDTSNFLIQQVSIVIGKNFVLSFQEYDTTLVDNIRKRLGDNPNQRLRQQGPDYLAYRIIDAIVDEYFVILDALSNEIEEAEERIISMPSAQNSRTIYTLKRQILMLRKAIWPMREVIGHLIHADDKLISNFTQLYLRDVYDHTIQATDTLETFRDMLSSMLDMYLSALTNRMNEIMKTLTIITTIFIPITSLASIYGMNFEFIPGLHSRLGYPIILVVMFLIALMMVIYFKKKKWI